MEVGKKTESGGGGRMDRPLFLFSSGAGGRDGGLRVTPKFLSWALL